VIHAKPVQFLLIAFGMMLHLFLVHQNSYSKNFSTKSNYHTCFSPEGHCTNQVIALINAAKSSINMATYSFTSWPIARALLRAKQRGVSIAIVCDRSLFKDRSVIRTLMKYHIPIWVDDTVSIAHNKYLILDKKTIETGSFNYTVSANRYNAENVLIINDPDLAQTYLSNFKHRVASSVPAAYYHYHPKPKHTRRQHQ